MTKIKLCGISRMCDIERINQIKPEYIGFVFAEKSKRFVPPKVAAQLKKALNRDIQAVGVFVDAPVEQVAALLNGNIIDMAQLHGREDEDYIAKLRALSGKPIIKAFRMENESSMEQETSGDCERKIAGIEGCSADYVLLDSGAGCGETFDWSLVKKVRRPIFLAGGLDAQNVTRAICETHPYAVDVSSGIETDGIKDKAKMTAFVAAVRMN